MYGRIVNTSSEAFLAGSAGQPNYAAAKGGIVGLTTSTALALAKYGVTANVICPRARTRMTAGRLRRLPGSRRTGRLDPLAPEHVAPLVGYLASPAAAQVNGQLLVVHGGMVAIVERPRVAGQVRHQAGRFTLRGTGRAAHPALRGPPGERDVRGGGGAGPEARHLTPVGMGEGFRSPAPPLPG